MNDLRLPSRPVRRRCRGALRPLGLLVLLSAVLTAGAPGIVRIRAGDTMWALARQHHTSVTALQRLNHMGARTTIYIGDLLKVPGNATPPARPTARLRTVVHTHVVRRGDTLTGIGRQYGVSPATVRSQNHLRSDVVQLGARLTVTTRQRVAPPRRQARNAGRVIPERVRRSAAAHRAALAAHRQPSRTAVHRAVAATARRHGVDPSFALAVAYHESGFQQGVVSPVDAVGVMQVLPSTGRLLGQAYGRRFDLLTARDNITAGVLLLGQLRRTTGSDAMALAGYYQGLGSVHERGVLPQTRDYIRNVGALRGRFSRG